MKLITFLLLGLAPLSAAASDGCERLPVDPEFPAGLGGAYEVVGRDPVTNQAYTGTLVVTYGKATYALTRTISGRSVHGDAWVERCGMDKIAALIGRYYANPTIKMVCSLDADGDNYNRLTCRTWGGVRSNGGLEAWFQKP
jgi:hypothetical protein